MDVIRMGTSLTLSPCERTVSGGACSAPYSRLPVEKQRSNHQFLIVEGIAAPARSIWRLWSPDRVRAGQRNCAAAAHVRDDWREASPQRFQIRMFKKPIERSRGGHSGARRKTRTRNLEIPGL